MSTNNKQNNLFNQDPAKKRTLPNEAHKLRDMGLIRIQGIIPIDLNNDLKSIARSRNMNADILVGEIILEAAVEIRDNKAREAAKRLREQFGDNWLEVLSSIKP
jgi:hypothetical protein